MAAEVILGAIAQKSADIAINLVVKEGSRLSGVKDDLFWIQTEMERIRSYLKDADAMPVRSEGVSNFIREIWDLAYDVEDIITTYFPRLSSSRSRWKRILSISHLRIARGFSKEVEGIRKRIEDIKNAKQTYGIDESRPSREEGKLDAIRRSFPHVDEPNVVGFDNLIQKLVQTVLDEDLHHRVISIIGMAGLGKTTLAKKVYNSVRQHFAWSAWICVSQRPSVKELLQDIARQVGLGQIERDVEANLFKFLSGRRYVIVVDDIWETKVGDALKNGLPTNYEDGSRIILTSRNKHVGLHVGGPNSTVELQPLDPETSRKLFDKLIMDDGSQDVSETQDPPQLEKIGEQLLKRCGGVPLAIVLATGLLKLRERSEVAWKGVLESMGQEQDECAKIFALSYNDLPLYLKPCFLYFGLFPEDRVISVFELINIWAAEGFIRGSRVREVEEVGEDYLNQLIARNLIQVVERRRRNGRVKCCCIHDVLHTLCIGVANEINFFYNQTGVNNRNPVLKLRRVTVSDVDRYISLNTPTSSLRATLCFLNRYKRIVIKDLNLRDSKFLRVLSVHECSPYSFSRPIEICNLRQLTYLKLGGCVDLPYAISNLTSLQTLDLRDTYIVGLPNVIWSMNQLRHILLPSFCRAFSFGGLKLDVFHRVEFSLPNLQTLYWLPVDIFKADWLLKLPNLRTLRANHATKDIIAVLLSLDATHAPHKLEELLLSGYGKLSTNGNWSQYENLSKLCLMKIRMTELPQHDKLPSNLTKIILRETYLKKDPMEPLKKLQKLKILKLLQDSYNGKELVCSGESGNFLQLQVFEIDRLSNLKVLVVEEGGMPRLVDFKINVCDPETRIPDRMRNIMKKTYEEGWWDYI